MYTNVSKSFIRLSFVYTVISFLKCGIEIISMFFKGNKGIIKKVLYAKYFFPIISFIYAYIFIKRIISFEA